MANVGIAEWSIAPALNFFPQPQVMCMQPQLTAFQHPQYMIMPLPHFVPVQPSYVPAPRSTVIEPKPVGSVKKWFNEKGFGFITKPDGGDVFVHHTSILAKGRASLEIGESVEFNIFISEDGREKAMDVTGPGGTFVKGSSEFYIADGGFNRKKQICFNFQNNGTCKFGAKCRYAHESPLGGNNGNAFEGEEKKPCFMFQNMGNCKFGYNCRFVHELVE